MSRLENVKVESDQTCFASMVSGALWTLWRISGSGRGRWRGRFALGQPESLDIGRCQVDEPLKCSTWLSLAWTAYFTDMHPSAICQLLEIHGPDQTRPDQTLSN